MSQTCPLADHRPLDKYKSSELIEQPLGLFQVGRLEALAKPTINRCEQLAGLVALASIVPEPRENSSRPAVPKTLLVALLLPQAHVRNVFLLY